MKFSVPQPLSLDSLAVQKVLKHYNLSTDNLLARGTEALVFRIPGSQTLLKLYNGTSGIGRMQRLKKILASTDVSQLTFALPEIHTVEAIEDVLCVVEQLLPGVSIETVYASAPADLRLTLQCTYLRTAYALRHITLQQPPERYLLFDTTEFSSVLTQSWYEFFFSFIEKAYRRNETFLSSELDTARDTIDLLKDAFCSAQCSRNYTLVHGDFFPGNVLVHPEHFSTAAVIDWGTFTMYGDPLYDTATACIFFDMYGDSTDALRKSLFKMACSLEPQENHAWLARYILGCAFLSLDLYQAGDEALAENAHCHWALGILKDTQFLEYAAQKSKKPD